MWNEINVITLELKVTITIYVRIDSSCGLYLDAHTVTACSSTFVGSNWISCYG
jgi:hypothetical protein